MKIKLNQDITDLHGKQIRGPIPLTDEKGAQMYYTDAEGEVQKDEKGNKIPVMQYLTLKEAIVDSLSTGYQDEPQLPGTEKLKRFSLALKIINAENEVSLIAEEIAEIKKVVNMRYLYPVIVGRVYEMLENSGGKEQ